MAQEMPCGILHQRQNEALADWMATEGWELYIGENKHREAYPETWGKAVESVRGWKRKLSTHVGMSSKGGENWVSYVGFYIEQILSRCPAEIWTTETYDLEETIEGIKSGSIFGFVEVDIHTPDHLTNKFSEFPPFFINANVQTQCEFTAKMREKLGKKIPKENRKLISVLSATKIGLYTPLIQWYLSHGLVVTAVHKVVHAERGTPFVEFTEWVSDERRKGDANPELQVYAELGKNTGNSAFGGTGMNKNRHTTVTYTGDEKVARKMIRSRLFHDMREIEQADETRMYEIISGKRVHNQNRPMHVASAIYGLAKLRMLEFYYDFMDKYFDRKDWQLMSMDTDSMYLGLAAEKLLDLVKPEMEEEFEREKHKWLVVKGKNDKRTPGIFKVESEARVGYSIVAKSHLYINDRPGPGEKEKKISLKGTSHSNNPKVFMEEVFRRALMGETPIATNIGFRQFDEQIYTYAIKKDAINCIYDKRCLMEDGITTYPIMGTF